MRYSLYYMKFNFYLIINEILYVDGFMFLQVNQKELFILFMVLVNIPVVIYI